jgi:hypothetical protein
MSFVMVLLVLLSMGAAWWRVVRVGKRLGVRVGWLHWFGTTSATCLGMVMFAALDAGGAWHLLTLVLVGAVVWLWLDDAMGALDRWARPMPTPEPETVAPAATASTNVSFLPPARRQSVGLKLTVDPIRLPDRVAFIYSSRDTGTKRRVVNVNKVMPLEYPPKFTGWCELANSVKTFRLDRIEGDVVRQDTGELLAAPEWFAALKGG